MKDEYNIYCDESCHLLRDDERAMVIGAVWCPVASVRETADQIRDIRQKHGIARFAETKWGGVSPAKLAFYIDLVEYFFRTQPLNYRAVVIRDKSILRHSEFDQTHDDFYYKIYFRMLEWIIADRNNHHFRIFLDIKDTRSADKIRKLHAVLGSSLRDHDRETVTDIQTVRSHDVQQIQLADLFSGAISYTNSYQKVDPERSEAKWELIMRIWDLARVPLVKSTDPEKRKFNILMWRPKGEGI